jgi:hypothetical protein
MRETRLLVREDAPLQAKPQLSLLKQISDHESLKGLEAKAY